LAWTEVTLTCRGLIVDETGRVVARPLRKFFNHNQPGAPVLGLDEPVSVTDKADGSLGIIYEGPEGLAVATAARSPRRRASRATPAQPGGPGDPRTLHRRPVKIKYEEYVHLHRLITGLSARTIWEALCAGATVEQIAEPLPDEFHGWVKKVSARLNDAVAALKTAVLDTYETILTGLPEGFSRKDFALTAARHELRGYLFAHLDGKDYTDALWQQVKPSADETPHGLFGQD
jgi:hypothetical protein